MRWVKWEENRLGRGKVGRKLKKEKRKNEKNIEKNKSVKEWKNVREYYFICQKIKNKNILLENILKHKSRIFYNFFHIFNTFYSINS